ncbi:MAG: hypothetical protein LBG47_02370 [Prevotellaceae bacterium]|jgi:hypothetical protein|nr:hypothetical protein [Prevotellaceae bacterium]
MSDTQHSSDDSLRRLFLQLHQPVTGADFEQEVMRKIRIAALKKRQSKLWEVKSTLLAAAVAAAVAAAAWMAMTALGELQLFFGALGQQLAQQAGAGWLLLLRNALSPEEVAYLMVEAAIVALAACLSNRKGLSAWNF